MKVFVAGATGVLGKRVVASLISKGFDVRAISRSVEKSEFLRSLGVEPAEIDLFDPSQVVEATEGCGAILHLATSIPQKTMPKPKDWLANDRIRIEGTQNLAKAARHHQIGRFIGQSVTALYGQQAGKTITDNTPIPDRQISMLQSALDMEKMIHEKLPDESIILRFGTFYSPDAFHTQDLVQNVTSGKMPQIGDGSFYWNFIHVDDAASAVVFALENFEKLKGKDFNITDFRPIRYKDLLNQLRQNLDGKKPMRLPQWLVKLALGRDVHDFLTQDYQIQQHADWQAFNITKTDMVTEITGIN